MKGADWLSVLFTTTSSESAADWTGGIRARVQARGLMPDSLRSVYKHHRLTLQQIHLNIWAKPLVLCNPSSGSAPKLNLLSNHQSTNTEETPPLLCKQSIVVKYSGCGCLFVKTSSSQRVNCVGGGVRTQRPRDKLQHIQRIDKELWSVTVCFKEEFLLTSNCAIPRWITEAFGQTTNATSCFWKCIYPTYANLC